MGGCAQISSRENRARSNYKIGKIEHPAPAAAAAPHQSFSFLLPRYPAGLPASPGTPCPFLTKDKDKEERRN
jgi:hypothetical protein